MTVDELLLNVYDYSFDSLVCQTAIQTISDVKAYQEQGYHLACWTADNFSSTFGVDVSKVFYTKSVGMGCIYFNPDTLTVVPLPVELILIDPKNIQESVSKIQGRIQRCEQEPEPDRYAHSINALAPGMRMEYFRKLVQKVSLNFPGLYHLFVCTYVGSDYGFKKVDAELLSKVIKTKTSADIQKTKRQLKALPDVVPVYRGDNSASTPYSEAFSWSLDINVANFFAVRRGCDNGYIAEGYTKKENILEALFEARNEREVLIDPTDVTITCVTAVKGLGELSHILPIVAPMYHTFRDEMYELDFSQSSDVHGRAHEARVLLLALIIAELLGLPDPDREILGSAAIYHDTKRMHDGVDLEHGRHSMDYYLQDAVYPNKLTAFLCEYHCRPDDEGYQKIVKDPELVKDQARAKLLYDIFKDADALDRVRFGIRDLDLNKLRLPISKSLTLFARITLEQLEIDE